MRLKKVADEIRRNVKSGGCRMPSAVGWLENYDSVYELRLRGKKHDHRLAYDESGRKLRDCYLPHIPIDAQVYARSWKALKWAARTFGKSTSEAWSEVLLPYIERAMKEWRKGVRNG